eukprot:2095201-Amphidinium_carterae.1
MMFPTAVLCCFVMMYSLLDVMGAGKAKASCKVNDVPYAKQDAKLPEEAYLAERAQMNQVEQFTGFAISTLSFAFFVNGFAAGVMSALYTVLRFLYTSKYRQSVGKTMENMGLTQYTIP